MEEGGRVEGTDKAHTWHIDPLDGTTNFLHAIPMFAISIALERDGQIVAGVVYNPADDSFYVAEKGQGAWGNNRRLRVSGRTELSQSLIGCGVPHLGKAEGPSALQGGTRDRDDARRQHPPHGRGVDRPRLCRGRDASTRSGSAASIPGTSRPGALLIREAGGFVSDADGGEDFLGEGTICCGNEPIHRQLLALLAQTA